MKPHHAPLHCLGASGMGILSGLTYCTRRDLSASARRGTSPGGGAKASPGFHASTRTWRRSWDGGEGVGRRAAGARMRGLLQRTQASDSAGFGLGSACPRQTPPSPHLRGPEAGHERAAAAEHVRKQAVDPHVDRRVDQPRGERRRQHQWHGVGDCKGQEAGQGGGQEGEVMAPRAPACCGCGVDALCANACTSAHPAAPSRTPSSSSSSSVSTRAAPSAGWRGRIRAQVGGWVHSSVAGWAQGAKSSALPAARSAKAPPCLTCHRDLRLGRGRLGQLHQPQRQADLDAGRGQGEVGLQGAHVALAAGALRGGEAEGKRREGLCRGGPQCPSKARLNRASFPPEALGQHLATSSLFIAAPSRRLPTRRLRALCLRRGRLPRPCRRRPRRGRGRRRAWEPSPCG
jgi:hypothetical protein